MSSSKLREGHYAGTSYVPRIMHRPATTATPRSTRGAEQIMKSDSSPGKNKKMSKNKKYAVCGGDPDTLYEYLHLGMNSNINTM